VKAAIYSGVWLPTSKREGRRRDGRGEGRGPIAKTSGATAVIIEHRIPMVVTKD
jgi:hypothetical protein